MHLTEDILHFIWKNSLFNHDDLQSYDNQKMQIISKGIHNHYSGPDFLEAKIKIGDTIWVGQVEIHTNSEDWYKHKHQNDPAYKNVILHVVYHHTKEVLINDQKIPVLVLNGRIRPILFERYKKLLSIENEIACKNQIKEVGRLSVTSQLERSLTDRLMRKSGDILKMVNENSNDWEEVSFRLIMFYMLGKENRQPAEWLANKIKYKKLRSMGCHLKSIEAILLGLGGFLNEKSDKFSQELYNEFDFQKSKWNLSPLDKFVWKYGRIRPAAFPQRRLIQLASIISVTENLFSKLTEFEFSDFYHLWTNEHSASKQLLSKDQLHLLLINVIVPIRFAYATYLQSEEQKLEAMELLFDIPAEKNKITDYWQGIGMKSTSAFDSQAIIELYSNQCIRKKCLTCSIGTEILRQ